MVQSNTSHPNKPLGFEIILNGNGTNFVTPFLNQASLQEPELDLNTFAPEFYPDSLTVMKKKKLNRYGNGCEGESVSIKAVKNREFHVSGVMLRSEIPDFHSLADHRDTVDLITPKAPNGGAECHVKKTELGKQAGWDPINEERQFEYSIDLVSTGRDEDGDGVNAIVDARLQKNQEQRDAERENLEDRLETMGL